MSDCVEVFVPGRLCVLGEHSDWAASYRIYNQSIEKGYAIVAGLNLGIYLRGWKSEKFSYQFEDKHICLTKDELADYSRKDFFEYVIASAKLVNDKFSVSGLEICCEKMTLPMKKGLASSAAICVAVIRLYNLIYELNLSMEEEMMLAYTAERSTGSLCGKMDQVCAYGQGLRLVEFDGSDICVTPLITNNEFIFLLVDLHGTKDTKKILTDLNSIYPFPQNKTEERLLSFLGDKNKEYVDNSVKAIINDDKMNLAKLLTQYQKQFDTDVACFSKELESSLLHQLMSKVCTMEGVLACKGVGSQGDGMAQILISDENAVDRVIETISREFSYDCYKLMIGQKYINAILPIAGKGTRLYPFTNIVDKAFLPIVYKKRVVPSLILILQELYSSKCIKSVDLIINEKQEVMFPKIEELLCKENIDVQLVKDYQIRNGFGGAISSSRFVNEVGYSLICLGDYIYQSKQLGECTRQIFDFWKARGEAVVGIKPVSISDVSSYGIVYGSWVDDKVLKIEGVVEKPDSLYAQENLMLEHCGKKEIFAFFGQYIINNDTLRKISLSTEENEIGLSEYLDEYARQYILYGYIIDGNSFDLGNAKTYYDSFVNYGKE